MRERAKHERGLRTRQIAKHEIGATQAKWYKAEERVHLRRLAGLGIKGHQPAIAAITRLTKEDEKTIIDSILDQKPGQNQKAKKQVFLMVRKI